MVCGKYSVDTQFETDAQSTIWGSRLSLISGMIRFQNLATPEKPIVFLSEECVDSFIEHAPRSIEAKWEFLLKSLQFRSKWLGHQFDIAEGIDFPLGCFSTPHEVRFALQDLASKDLLELALHSRDVSSGNTPTCAVTLKLKAYDVKQEKSTPRYTLGHLVNDLSTIESQRERLKASSPPRHGFAVPAIRKGSVEEAQYWARLHYQQSCDELARTTFGKPGIADIQLVVDKEWGERLSVKRVRILRAGYCESAHASIVDADRMELLSFSTWVKTHGSINESMRNTDVPTEIRDSLDRFRKDHSDPSRTAFLIMQFGDTKLHQKIVKAVRATFAKNGITVVRADDKEYHSHLYFNILTYMHGCGIGIAIFERINSDDFNPNVSLEVGYMLAQGKPVCLMKDKTLKSLQSDLVGTLYRNFDPQDAEKTIENSVDQWLSDRELSKPS